MTKVVQPHPQQYGLGHFYIVSLQQCITMLNIIMFSHHSSDNSKKEMTLFAFFKIQYSSTVLHFDNHQRHHPMQLSLVI